MKTYIILIKYTQQGIQNIKESPARLDAARKAAVSMGANLREWYLVMGQYDAVVIGEAPDDATMARLLLAIAAQGNVSTQTLSAFTEDEYRKLFAGM